jgi:cob(I)alamin adenosyltransferase
MVRKRAPRTSVTNLTVDLLKQIRDGISGLNQRVDGLNARVERVEARLDENNQRMGRVEQGLVDLGQFMRQIALDQARHERFHLQHVDLLEKDVAEVKERVRRLEERSEA